MREKIPQAADDDRQHQHIERNALETPQMLRVILLQRRSSARVPA